MPTNDVKFYVSDKIYTGWETVQIQRNVDSLCGSFNLRFYDRWGSDAKQWPMIPNKSIKIDIGNQRVVTGYIDDLSIEYDDSESSMSISGRDKACDLVDCSAVPKEYTNLTADKIAKELLKPFGIELVVEADPGEKFSKWSVKPGESIFENLERLGKLRALFFISDEYAVVKMQQRGSTKSNGKIVRGQNIKSASIKYDNVNRFSNYYIIGQSAGSDTFSGDKTVSAKGSATDQGVNRHRPLILMAEGNADSKSSQLRANWELSVRIANAMKLTVTVYGWTTANGKIWRVNELVDVDDPVLGVYGEMLISSVNFLRSDDEGTTTQMDLVRKEAFLPEPEVIKESASQLSDEEEE